MQVLAAIDIGSNAARLLVNEVHDNDGNKYFKKRSLVRVPLRLGQTVFEQGYIPPYKEQEVLSSMKAYKLLMEVHHVEQYRAVATSAMRDAQNGEALRERVRQETGIEIEIISGIEEARILYATHFEDVLQAEKSYLYVDVGGGSTEMSLFSGGAIQHAKSFNIGTIRLLNGQVEESQWQYMQKWVKDISKGHKHIEGIGSGGNINKLYKLAQRTDKYISYDELKDLYERLQNTTNEQRIVELGMRSDRADVVVHANKIFVEIMQTAGVQNMHVPKFGLSDGLVRQISQNVTL